MLSVSKLNLNIKAVKKGVNESCLPCHYGVGNAIISDIIKITVKLSQNMRINHINGER